MFIADYFVDNIIQFLDKRDGLKFISLCQNTYDHYNIFIFYNEVIYEKSILHRYSKMIRYIKSRY